MHEFSFLLLLFFGSFCDIRLNTFDFHLQQSGVTRGSWGIGRIGHEGYGQGLLTSLTSGVANVSTVFSVFYFVASPFPDNMDQEDTDDAQVVVLPSPHTSQQLIT